MGEFASLVMVSPLDFQPFVHCKSKKYLTLILAGLVQDYPDTMQYATIYGEGAASEEEKAATWDEIDISEGIIAVSHTWTDSHGVPRSQPFPWDDTKDIYVIGGYHNMHCLKLLQAYSADAHAGRKSLVPYHHVSHCLDVLRQNVLCEADDVLLAQKPRALGGLDKRPGDGQARQCKDWNKLSLFAQEHNACYKRLNITKGAIDTGVKSEFERYAFCPEGSPYKEKVEKYFEEYGHRVIKHVDEWAEKPGEHGSEGHQGHEEAKGY